jgi:Tfp pilus assembly protein FimT
MASLKHSGAKAGNFMTGFTLIEVILTAGIMAVLLAVGLPVSLDFYNQYQFDSELDTLISVLESARNLAMINYNESAHGVYIGANNFIIFQGPSFASRNPAQDKNFPRNSVISITGASEVVFSALSGQTASTTFTVANAQRSVNINVNSEGTINY